MILHSYDKWPKGNAYQWRNDAFFVWDALVVQEPSSWWETSNEFESCGISISLFSTTCQESNPCIELVSSQFLMAIMAIIQQMKHGNLQSDISSNAHVWFEDMEFSQILETQSHMVDHFFIEIAMGTYSAETDHISYIVGCMLITYSTVSLFVNQYIYIYIYHDYFLLSLVLLLSWL